MILRYIASTFFFFNDTATTEIYTLSLHDALPICLRHFNPQLIQFAFNFANKHRVADGDGHVARSEEHTSELQSHSDLVCRLLLEKKKTYCAVSLAQRAVLRRQHFN